jgi:hypothetical protein
MPSFFEIVSKESMKGIEGDTASLIFVRTKLDASRSFLVWKYDFHDAATDSGVV